ncbi:MAG: hypothetical protein KAH21_06975, partial [Spirochaetaceae bacterium]|nr:hypothetical protein [Spirochaetaceae bacterium]
KGLTGVVLIILAVTVILLSGCDEVEGIFGTITFDMGTVPSKVYVILDKDNVLGNGNEHRVNINITSETLSVPYFLDTTDVAAGTYYLLGAWIMQRRAISLILIAWRIGMPMPGMGALVQHHRIRQILPT